MDTYVDGPNCSVPAYFCAAARPDFSTYKAVENRIVSNIERAHDTHRLELSIDTTVR